jgi:NTP pyrophosphatase (non-canonical NTP hydrolase)
LARELPTITPSRAAVRGVTIDAKETPMPDSLTELQDAVEAFVAERDWAQFHTPKNLAMGVAIEAAELMEHFLWSTEADAAILDAARRAMIAQEMGDVLIYLVLLGQVLEIDLVSAAAEKLALNRDKYPVEKAKGRATKYLDLE